MDSFARRFYREATSPSKIWLAPAALIIVAIAVASWYYFSVSNSASPFRLETISIRKLSQSNNVALSVISPDGRSVAYVTYEDDGGRALWLRRVSETNAINVSPSQQVHYWDIAFSNDGEYIYFITAPRFGTHGTLFRVPSLGGQPRRIAEKVNHLGNLSRDGKQVLYVRYGDPAPDTSVNVTDSTLIAAGSEDGSSETVIKSLKGESIIRKARYSADGRWIFYIKRELKQVERWSIVMLDAQTGRERELINEAQRIEAIAPLKDGNGILMNALDGTSNRRQLFYVSINTGETTRVTNDLNSYSGVSVDDQGRNIVAVQRTDSGRLWVGQASDLKSMTPLSRELLAHQVVDWTPDGRIVFDAVDNDRLSVWIANADGSGAVQLTSQDSDNSYPRVSGEGRYIVFTSRRAGFNQVWRMNIDGSNQILLADVPGITQAPKFAADGRTVVFRWYHDGAAPLGQVSVDGGTVAGIDYVPSAFTYYWSMSPDGKHIAFTKGGNVDEPMTVIVRPADSSTPSYSLDIRPTWIFKWMPDSKRIFYQESQRGESLSSKVFEIDPLKGDPKLLIATEPDDIVDLTYSVDGTRVAAVRQTVLSDAVLLNSGAGSSARDDVR